MDSDCDVCILDALLNLQAFGPLYDDFHSFIVNFYVYANVAYTQIKSIIMLVDPNNEVA